MHALVVDDSRAMRAILSRQLDALGFDVAQARDGADALTVLDGGQHPDVVTGDVLAGKLALLGMVPA